MQTQKFDIVIIGTGPGGEGAAIHAAKNDKSVAIVEQYADIGGSCTHLGTIPSKALRWSIFEMTSILNSRICREAGLAIKPSLPQLRAGARGVIERQVEMRRGFYERNHIPMVKGHATFVDAHELIATEPTGAMTRLEADRFIICTGSRPYRPADVDFKHPRIFDSDTILGLDYTPDSIGIYGAGVVGCEYASMFRNLGTKVNLVNTRDKLLDFLDDEIIDALAYHMRDRDVRIRHREEYDRIVADDAGVEMHLKSGKVIKSDVLLWANGRTGNSDGMGLETLGIQPDKRGNIPVNEHYQTAQPHIYAAGDVIGYPSLASAAYVQGRYAASHAVGEPADLRLILDIPTGIYTSPEISSVGKTERQLTEAKVPFELGHAQFRALARAQITGQTVGILKLLFHRHTLEILGVHCFGANAAEIIHIGQAIMNQPAPNNSLKYFIDTTFNYPTMAEAYRVAALNGFNRL